MGDIDFEELDRAVNALSSKTPNDNIASQPPVIQIDSQPGTNRSIDNAVISPSQPVDSTPPVSDTLGQPIVASQNQTQPLASQRSSGRFMDMIHPSADMRPASQTDRTPPVLTSQARPQPLKTDSNLSMAEIRDIANPAPVIPEVGNFNDNTAALDDSKPLENPFIAGAKIEKRPLGTFSQLQNETPVVELSPSGEVNDNLEQSEAIRQDTSFGVQEELKEDILQVESANEPPTVQVETVNDKEAALEPSVATPYIVQQYKETKKEDTKPAPIYDTNVYHQPIKTDSKKKSGWLWLVWIIGLVALGVGSGVLAYFYILPLF